MSVGDMKRYECICHKDHDVNIVNCAPNERRLVLQVHAGCMLCDNCLKLLGTCL